MDRYVKKGDEEEEEEGRRKKKRTDTSTRLLCGYEQHFSWKQIERQRHGGGGGRTELSKQTGAD